MVYTARKLRKDLSLPEGILWKRIRGKQIGAKFRRQHPIGPYVVDFYRAAARLVVEVDGFAHDNIERIERDARRDRFLVEQRYDVLRLAAADILSDVEGALTTIAARVANPLHHDTCGVAVPLLASGEELG